MVTNSDLEKFREEWKKRQLGFSKRPKCDYENGNRISNDRLWENINRRLKHLSKVLFTLYKIYKEDKDLYGDAFLSFVGNEVVRGWPWKDFPLTSKKASEILGKVTTGLTNNEIKVNPKEIHYEHWTPISFFRDLFDNFDDLTEDNFYYVLKKYYKVVRITNAESEPFKKEYRTTRPVDIYETLKIDIIEEDYFK